MPLTGNEPVASHGFQVSGVTGGIQFGYNRQIDPSWVIGIETDFSGSTIRGSGNGTNVLATSFTTQTVSSEQKLDWWGTLRARLGFLPRNDLLLLCLWQGRFFRQLPVQWTTGGKAFRLT